MNILSFPEMNLTPQEHAEAIASGILSTIKSLEDLIRKHPTLEFDCVAKDLDDAIERTTDLWVAATRVKRRKDVGLAP